MSSSTWFMITLCLAGTAFNAAFLYLGFGQAGWWVGSPVLLMLLTGAGYLVVPRNRDFASSNEFHIYLLFVYLYLFTYFNGLGWTAL